MQDSGEVIVGSLFPILARLLITTGMYSEALQSLGVKRCLIDTSVRASALAIALTRLSDSAY